MRSTYKTIGLWVILIVLFVAFYNFFSQGNEQVDEPAFTQLLSKVEKKEVRAISIKGNVYSGEYADSKTRFRTTGPVADTTMLTKLQNMGVDVKYEEHPDAPPSASRLLLDVEVGLGSLQVHDTDEAFFDDHGFDGRDERDPDDNAACRGGTRAG